MCVYVFIYMCIYMCVCVCVCVFLPGDKESQVGCRLWGRTESDTTDAT